MSNEVAADGVASNVIVPGRISTPRTDVLDLARSEREGRPVREVEADILAGIPARRYGRPEEYGAVAAFLAGRQAAYVTGSVVRVDGGRIPTV
mgnify:FL=1